MDQEVVFWVWALGQKKGIPGKMGETLIKPAVRLLDCTDVHSLVFIVI